MVLWKKVLKQLQATTKDFNSLYSLMIKNFSDEIFSRNKEGSKTISYTYSDLDILTRQIANKIIDQNLEKDAFVAISMDNSIVFIAAFFGVLMSGKRPLLINYRLTEAEISHVYLEANCQTTITDNKFVPKGLIFRVDDFENYPIYEGEFLGNEFALLTSGTTGMPKIIIYDGLAVSEQIMAAGEVIKGNTKAILHNRKLEIKVLAFLPFYHIFGLMATFLWFAIFGRTFIFLEDYTPKTIQETIKEFKVTHILAVPMVWHGVSRAIFNQAAKDNKLEKLNKAINFSIKLQRIMPKFGQFIAKNMLFKSIRKKIFGQTPSFMVSGGAYVDAETLKLFNALGYNLFNGYGSTEAGIVSVAVSKKIADKISGHVGKPLSHYTYNLNEGILSLNSNALFKGYFEDGKLLLRNKKLLFDSRDYFDVDKNNNLYIVARKDDILLGENGENIAPDKIEAKIHQHQSISELSIIQPNPQKSAEKILVIKFTDEANEFEQQVALKMISDSFGKLTFEEKISSIYLSIDSYKTALDKVKRAVVRKDFVEKPNKFIKLDLIMDANEITNRITETITKQIVSMMANILNTDINNIDENTDFIFDLNGTSLDYFSLLNEIAEVFKINLMVQELSEATTPKKIARLIKEKVESS